MEDDSKRSPAPVPEQPKAATPREALAGQAAPAKRSFSVSSAPAMELPKGGGAIRGLGETFKVNSATGTASFGVPLPISPAPRGPTPDLGLSYDSGGGNSPFGLGWAVSLPAITRKTDKKLPEYLDSEDSDLFLLSGAEDLVPTLDALGARVTTTSTVGSVTTKVDRYRPRVEGLFSIIERVTTIDTSASPPKSVHWRAITKDNTKSTFGSTAATRITDPNWAHKVYSWLLEKTEDDRGNVVLYEYKAENRDNEPVGKPSETHHKDGLAPVTANKYLKRVRYGNKVMGSTTPTDFCFELVFDYGEHTSNTPTEAVPWPCRQDMYSSFRPGFELRTYRLCRRVLMFHRFSELAPNPTLVRSLDLTYQENKRFSKLTSAQLRGYQHNGATYDSATLPPVSFSYTADTFSKSIKDLGQTELGDDYPQMTVGQNAEWVDLNQEGLPGLLIDYGSAHRFKRNNGGSLQGAALLSSVPSIAAKPVQLLDIAGAGTLSMVLRSGNESGYAERTADGWAPFIPFKTFPTVDLNDPNVRLLDLNGDGFEDILITRGDHLLWYPSLGREGFGYARRIPIDPDPEKGPRTLFAEAFVSVTIADMNGDGLADIVRITHAGVVYWPNLGHGRFGAAVRMDTPPWLAPVPLEFDARRLRLADLDGTGTADLCYFTDEGLQVYRNQSGNSFAPAETFPGIPPQVANNGQFVDFYGSGTSVLLWSTTVPGFFVKAWDPLNHVKPHLLTEVDNHMGRIVKMQYAPSTNFYVQDRLAGKPWVTKLPFPVHVVERVESYDAIRRARLITTYRYRHGHYDTHEREFRGFGYVEQTDAELFGKDHGQGLFPTYPAPINNEIPQAPVLTKTWFHTGAWKERAAQGAQYQTEYWNGDSALANVPHLECTITISPNPQELREAARALRGTTLRTEVYELDGDLAKQAIPHAVTETCVTVRKLQAPQNALGSGRPQLPGVFHTVPKESRSWAYDRVANDPRTSQSLAILIDDYGNITRGAAVSYPRRVPAHAEQSVVACVVTESNLVHFDATASGHRLGIPVEAKTWDLTGQTPPLDNGFFSVGDVQTNFTSAATLNYEVAATSGLQKRLVQHECAQYYNNAALAPLLQGTADTRALLYKSYVLDMTPGLISGAYAGKANSPELDALVLEGKYVTPSAGMWVPSTSAATAAGHWLPSGHAVFNPAAFYLPSSVVDPFDNSTTIAYDTYNFFALTITDPLANVVSATHDYRVLAPQELTDPNGNRQEAAFDALGMIKAMAVKGKVGSSDGDTITAPTIEYSYDYTRWDTAQKPNWVKVKARETHGTSPTPKFQESVVFSDGSGAVVMTKAQAEPASVGGPARYVGTGRTVLNNKGNPVKQYEPYFSANNEYENEDAIVTTGVTPVITYDGLGRVLRTDLPNGTYSRVERSPWLETAYDPNDTVDEPGNRWKSKRIPTALPTPSLQEQRALTLTQLHAATPTKTHMDSLGRAFLVIAHNKVGTTDEFHETRTTLDIEGQVLTVTDALGRVCQTNVYSMAGKILKDTNLDKGSRWNFHDVGGALIRRFDDRSQVFRLSYDALRRPTHLHLKPGAAAEVLLQRTVYGDSSGTGITDPKVNNLRGKPIRLFDGAGRIRSESYDFKGNSLTSDRKLAITYTTTPDWTSLASINNVATLDSTAASLLEAETFTESREYDALGRVTKVTAPDNSQFIPTYNEASLLEKVDVKIRGAASATPFVANIDYDAKGQRTAIVYSAGNFKTDYSYDSLTFRLTRVLTTRISPSETLQDLNCTFDPVGNIIEVTDAAQQSLLFTNGFATVPNKYEYDAVYRLKRGEGREHKSVGDVQVDHNDQAIWNLPHPNDPQAIRSYFETYAYDKIGNILEMFHNAGGGANTWTRTYTYQSIPSVTNRLASHNIPGGTATYSYDNHGSMTSMPHLSSMSWTPFDQMQSANKGGGGIVYFTYGADGQRVRKVWDKTASLREERIYLGGYEVYREKTSGVTQLERQTLHVMDGAKRLAMVETKTISGGAAVTPLVSMFRYQLGNHLGSAVLEVDAAGLIISYEEYSPYGSSAYRSSRSGVDVSARRYRYVGLERDNETGLDSMGARYYAAWLGRWTSADPLGVGADGPGVYNYTRGSPVVLTDPGGMEGGKPNPFFSGSYKDRPAVQCKPTDESAASRAASAAFVEMFGTGSLPTYGPAVGQSQTASEPKPMDESIVDSLDRGAASVLQVGVDAVLFGLEHGVARPLSSLSGTANAPTSETEAAAGEESMGDAEFGLRVGLLRLGLTKSGAGPLALFNMATTVSSHDDPDMIPATIGVAAGLRVQSGAPEAAAPVASETIAAQLRDQVAQLRKSENIGKQRNTAGSALELRGEVVETNLAVSGLKERGPTRAGPQQRLLVAKKLGHMRDTDSEFKLFENFANEHSTQTRGTLHVYTDRVPCDSCVDVAVQLESIFPNLKVQFYWGDYK